MQVQHLISVSVCLKNVCNCDFQKSSASKIRLLNIHTSCTHVVPGYFIWNHFVFLCCWATYLLPFLLQNSLLRVILSYVEFELWPRRNARLLAFVRFCRSPAGVWPCDWCSVSQRPLWTTTCHSRNMDEGSKQCPWCEVGEAWHFLDTWRITICFYSEKVVIYEGTFCNKNCLWCGKFLPKKRNSGVFSAFLWMLKCFCLLIQQWNLSKMSGF